jgi:membrane protease YdiL (CAAX protease family)
VSSRRSLLWAPTGRLRTPWRLVIAGVIVLVVTVGVAVVAAVAGLASGPGAVDGPGLPALLVVLVLEGVAVSAAVLLAGRYLDRRRLADLGLGIDATWWRDLGVGAALGVALVGGAYVVGLAAGVYEASVDPAVPAGGSLPVVLALLAATMVAVGCQEELLLRGYVLTNLAEGVTAVVGRRAAVGAALVISSVAFGLLHGLNPNAGALGLLTITLAGGMLGAGYVWTGSLALPVGLHVTWNLAHALLGLPVSGLRFGVRLVATDASGPPLLHGGAFGPEGGLLGFGATLAGCLGVIAYARASGRGFQPAIAEPSLRE